MHQQMVLPMVQMVMLQVQPASAEGTSNASANGNATGTNGNADGTNGNAYGTNGTATGTTCISKAGSPWRWHKRQLVADVASYIATDYAAGMGMRHWRKLCSPFCWCMT